MESDTKFTYNVRMQSNCMYISGHLSQAGIMLTYNQQLLMCKHQQLLLCIIEPQLQLAASIKHN